MRRLFPYVGLAVLVLGSGFGIGLGLSEAPAHPPHASSTPTTTTSTPSYSRTTVPNVVGLSAGDAAAMLAAAGLSVSNSPGTSDETVVSQSPDAGSVVARGSEVTLTFSAESSLVEQPDPFPGQLMQFATPNSGWLIVPGESPVFHTDDGGTSWRETYAGPLRPRWIDAVGPNDAWAIAVGPRYEAAGLLRTTDGGVSWTRVVTSGPTLSAIDFLTSKDGWALSPDGSLLRTEDGGRRWRAVPAAPPAGTLCATTLGQIWIGGADGDVYTSANSGQTWDLSLDYAQVTRLPPFAPSVALIPWLTCSASDAWAVYDWGEAAGSSAYVVFETSDSGGQWSPALANELTVASDTLPSASNSLSNAGTSVGGFAWFLGNCGPCRGTGTVEIVTMTGSSPPKTTQLPEVVPSSELDASFLNTKDGWLIGASPSVVAGAPPPKNGYRLSVFATTDGGARWHMVGTINP